MNEGLHHLNTRKRIYKKLEKFPSPSRGRRAYDYLMIGVAIFGPLALAPQVLEIYRTHDVSGLVISTWAFLALFNVLWMIYGIIHKEFPIVAANVAAGCFNIAGVVGILIYAT